MIVVLPVFSPLVANAQEPIIDVEQKVKQSIEKIEENKKEQQKEAGEVRDTRLGTDSSKAKNVAYGESGGSEDNGVGTIDIETTTISNFEYKINAMTHEVIVRFNIDTDITADDYTFAMNIEDGSGNIVTIDESNDESDISDGYIKDLGTGASGTYDLEVATGSLEARTMDRAGNYNIYFTNTSIADSTMVDIVEIKKTATKVDSVNIEIPETIVYEGTSPLASDDILYSLVGDGVNSKTDTDNISNKGKVEPSTTLGYGIYEMESVGYEEANVSDADWTSDDLTLAKYDHVIRPMDENYLVAKDIDGEVSSTNTDADNVGGFGLDGYRPIGQVIGSTGDGVTTFPGDDSVAFTGSVSGDVDEILGDTQENTYISNMYINEPTFSNVGMIAIGDDISIDNLGIVDSQISGKRVVGSFAGQIKDSDTDTGEGNNLLNVYALESEDDSSSIAYEVTGIEDNIGGIVGLANYTNIYSDTRFTGDIPGIDLTSDVQPNSIYPDHDGYKTFSTIDIENGNNATGGIAGQGNYLNISKVYNKGNIDVLNGKQVGGIIGNGSYLNIMNIYNTGNITVHEDTYNSGYNWDNGLIVNTTVHTNVKGGINEYEVTTHIG